LAEDGSLAHNAFTYTAREYHPRSGLYYYRARFYDPEMGRFITQDPIGFLGGVNLHAYVGNEPVGRIDPLGLYGMDVHFFYTYFWAREAGFDHSVAYRIARANQWMDEGSNKPTQNPWAHFKTRLEAENFIRGAIASGDPEAFGIYLHILQDTYSHEGYWPIPGHAWDTLFGNDPDKYCSTSDRDSQMREATKRWLKHFKNFHEGKTF